MKIKIALTLLFVLLLTIPALAQDTTWMRINTFDVQDRAIVANSGADIIYVDPKDGWVVAEVPAHRMTQVQNFGFNTQIIETKDTMPSGYEAYHDYDEMVAELQVLHAAYPAVTSLFSIGQTYEGRELWCLKISDNPDENETDEGGAFIIGRHHAREILTTEVALYTANQLLEDYGQDEMITAFVDNREIFIVPNLNPDGSTYDHSGTLFKLWRKNRTPNGNWPSFCWGTDLNRNYGFQWGGAGSTGFACDLTYHGAEAFSELETQAVRDFCYAHENINTLISLHTYSELVLYPWGFTNSPIDDTLQQNTFVTLANYMAAQNGYTPKQASGLYPTTGDTTDWAYAELGIYAFTFELSPSSMLNGLGFYPKPDIIPTAGEDNYNAMLIAIGMSQNPTYVLGSDLWKLEGSLDGSTANFKWAPVLETNPIGWNLLKFQNGSYEPVNASPIPAGQAEYTYSDTGLKAGENYQYLVEYLYDGGQLRFGPIVLSMGDDDDDDTGDDDDDEGSSSDDSDDDSGCCG